MHRSSWAHNPSPASFSICIRMRIRRQSDDGLEDPLTSRCALCTGAYAAIDHVNGDFAGVLMCALRKGGILRIAGVRGLFAVRSVPACAVGVFAACSLGQLFDV